MNRKILIVGSNGLLGQKSVAAFHKDYQVETAGLEPELVTNDRLPYLQIDITQRANVEEVIAGVKPDVVLNAAAYTQVDKAEVEREACDAVNITGVENLSDTCRKYQSRLIHISTDYIFDGEKGDYSEEDAPHPINYYGRSKLEGERVVVNSGCEYIIARTAVLFGTGIAIQNNFALWALRQLKAGNAIRVVDDQIGNPTIADYLAEALVELDRKDAQGVFHVAGKESISRYDFTVAIAKKYGLDDHLITPIKSKDFTQMAPRPKDVSLNVNKVLKDYQVELYTVDRSLTKLQEKIKK